MGFDKVSRHDVAHNASSRFDCSLNGQKPIWPDLADSRECFQGGSCPPSRVDRYDTKALEEKGLLHRFSLHGVNRNAEMCIKSEDLYRFSGDRNHKRVEHVVNFEEYEARIRKLEARLAVQIEKLERLIAAHSSPEPKEPIAHNYYSKRANDLLHPADGAHFVYDRNGYGQLIGPNGEHQYNLVNGKPVWIKDTDYKPAVVSGCSNGSCGSCSGCRPRTRSSR